MKMSWEPKNCLKKGEILEERQKFHLKDDVVPAPDCILCEKNPLPYSHSQKPKLRTGIINFNLIFYFLGEIA